jgi:hypothetical protein
VCIAPECKCDSGSSIATIEAPVFESLSFKIARVAKLLIPSPLYEILVLTPSSI